MKGLIRELRGPRTGKGRGSKIYQRATRDVHYMAEVPNLPKLTHLKSEMHLRWP